MILGIIASGIASEPPVGAPGKVQNFAAVSGGTTQIDLSWDDLPDEDSYEIERSADGASGWSQIATPGQNVVSYNDTGLNSGETWYYRCRGVNVGGNGEWSDTASATTDFVSPIVAGVSNAAAVTSGSNFDLTKTGLGTPMASMALMINRSGAAGGEAANISASMGFSDSAAATCMVANSAENASSSMRSGCRARTADILGGLTGSNGTATRIDLSSYIVDGMTLSVATGPGENSTAMALMLESLTGATLRGSVSGSQSGLVFQPDLILGMHQNAPFDGNSKGHMRWNFGAAYDTGAGIERANYQVWCDTGVGTTAVNSMLRTDSFLSWLENDAGSPQWTMDITGMTPDGWTVDDVSRTYSALALNLNGAPARVTTLETPNTPGLQFYDLGMRPQALILLTCNHIDLNAVRSNGTGGGYGLFFVDADSTAGIIFTVEDNVGTSNTRKYHYTDIREIDHTGTLNAVATLDSFSGTGVTLSFSQVSGQANKWLCVAIG